MSAHAPIALVTRLGEAAEAEWLRVLSAAMPDEALRALPAIDAAERERVEIAIVADPDPADVAGLKNLAFVQSLWAGVEKLAAALPADGPPIVRLTDGEMARTMAEAALAWTYFLQRDMPAYAAQQREKVWRQRAYRAPGSMTVGLIGLGALGAAAAGRLVEAGFRVAGWSRTLKQVSGVETFAGPDGLQAVLARSDVVIVLAPLTPETRGLIDAEKFAAMTPGAALINFARGPLVATDDLLAALDEGRLSHAVLDVFDVEPLPGASRLWSHERVTVLPHISAPTDMASAARTVAANVAAFRETGAIPAAVDRAAGYQGRWTPRRHARVFTGIHDFPGRVALDVEVVDTRLRRA